MSSKKSQLSRRDFFFNIGKSSVSAYLASNAHFIKFMGGTLATLMASKSYASGQAKNYLSFLHPGAPPRWNFDGFLASEKPIIDGASTAEFIPHPVVKNVFKASGTYKTLYSGRNDETTYETSSIPESYFDRTGTKRDLYVPKLWDISLPIWKDGVAKLESENPILMRNLLNEILMIRGFHLPADFGHFSGPQYLIQPERAHPSISGLAADQAINASPRRLIPAVALTDNPSRPLGFRSESAKLTLGTSGGGGNKASDILSPFLRTDGLVDNHKGNRALMEAVMKEAMDEYKKRALAENPRSSSLYQDNSAVDELMQKLKGTDLIDEFSSARYKYSQLGKACTEKFPGLVGEIKLSQNADGVYGKHGYATDHYSSNFALAEVFIRHNLTTSFTFLCGKTAAPGSYVGKRNTAHLVLNDEHKTSDRQLSFLAHNWKNRFFMSCVQELKGAIGPAWKNTVLQYGAEYNRSPNKGSGGSDHAINACCTTLISGAIDGFMPVGNIYKTSIKNSAHKNYGTYGVGAPININGVGNKKLTHKIVANTVFTLLGIQSPFRDKWSLIKTDSGSFSLNAEHPQNKD